MNHQSSAQHLHYGTEWRDSDFWRQTSPYTPYFLSDKMQSPTWMSTAPCGVAKVETNLYSALSGIIRSFSKGSKKMWTKIITLSCNNQPFTYSFIHLIYTYYMTVLILVFILSVFYDALASESLADRKDSLSRAHKFQEVANYSPLNMPFICKLTNLKLISLNHLLIKPSWAKPVFPCPNPPRPGTRQSQAAPYTQNLGKLLKPANPKPAYLASPF